jgi:hypothetical protein
MKNHSLVFFEVPTPADANKLFPTENTRQKNRSSVHTEL